MENEKVSVSLVGCGHWGGNIARALHKIGCLHSLVDSNEEVLFWCGNKVGTKVASYTCLDDVLSDPTVDAVAVATPPGTHADLAIAAMVAGKHVFVEKPMALSLADARRMAHCAATNGVKLFVGHVFEYNPAVARMVEMTGAGMLGEIEYIYSRQYGSGRIRDDHDALISLAPHDVALLLRFGGRVEKVHGSRFGGVSQPGCGTIQIEFPRATGLIHVSWLHPTKERRLLIVGEQGALELDDVRHEVYHYPRQAGMVPYRREDANSLWFDLSVEPLLEELKAFIAHVVDDAEVQQFCRPMGALQVMGVLEEATK